MSLFGPEERVSLFCSFEIKKAPGKRDSSSVRSAMASHSLCADSLRCGTGRSAGLSSSSSSHSSSSSTASIASAARMLPAAPAGFLAPSNASLGEIASGRRRSSDDLEKRPFYSGEKGISRVVEARTDSGVATVFRARSLSRCARKRRPASSLIPNEEMCEISP